MTRMSVSETCPYQFTGPGCILPSGIRHERFRLIAFETRDPRGPTSPRREASLFDSPGPKGPASFFRERPSREAFCRWRPDTLKSGTN